jgi:PII-like signaling protein
MTLAPGPASRLTIFLHADAYWHHHSLSDEIIHRALQAGLSGASRFHGIEGYGRSGVLHTDIDPDIMSGLPAEVVIVDPSSQRVRDFLPQLDEILDHGIAVIDTVEVAFVSRPTTPPPPSGPVSDTE